MPELAPALVEGTQRTQGLSSASLRCECDHAAATCRDRGARIGAGADRLYMARRTCRQSRWLTFRWHPLERGETPRARRAVPPSNQVCVLRAAAWAVPACAAHHPMFLPPTLVPARSSRRGLMEQSPSCAPSLLRRSSSLCAHSHCGSHRTPRASWVWSSRRRPSRSRSTTSSSSPPSPSSSSSTSRRWRS